MKILASVRAAGVALLVATAAAQAPAFAQNAPAPMTNGGATGRSSARLINVSSCDPQRSVAMPAYGAFSPGFYPYPPYYWNDPYGFSYLQPPLQPTSGTLSIDYRNITQKVMKTIDFGLVANGRLVAEVRDVGTFSPNAEIKHQFGLDPNVFPLRTALSRCVPLHVIYADGTTWTNASLQPVTDMVQKHRRKHH
jgi:hypothetical protein